MLNRKAFLGTAAAFSLLFASWPYAHAGESCPAVTQVSKDRGQIHTEVFDVHTGRLRSIFYARTFMSGPNAFVVFGTSAMCPPQGCAVDPPGQIQDCTATAPPYQFFDWALTHGAVQLITQQVGLDVKRPSGTLVMEQSTGSAAGGRQCKKPLNTAGVLAVHTAVADKISGAGLSVVSARVYAKQHPGSSLIDFYALIGVDSSNPFAVPPPGSQAQDCTTSTTNPQGWYDLYWSASNHTLSEAIVLDPQYPGALQLNQGM